MHDVIPLGRPSPHDVIFVADFSLGLHDVIFFGRFGFHDIIFSDVSCTSTIIDEPVARRNV